MDKVETDIQEFHTLHPQKKLKVLAIIAAIFIASVAGGLYFSTKSNTPSTTTKDSEAPKGTSQLIMQPETLSITKGQTIKVSVMVKDTGSQATDIAIGYDPKLVEVSNIVNGDVFPDMLRSEIVNNQIIVSAAVDPNNPNDIKTGTVFSFMLKGLTTGEATLTFDKDITIAATNGVNTLGSAEPVTITVK
ncbi:MAG: hypothetical protein UZ22_OP11002000403 [Microgenomates bacterium OLB23]|nr:MAG: hypothetical protein UZ22_OP11002000403 [Microgenomates bacterium OLB23]